MYLNDIVSENQTRRQAAAKQMVKSGEEKMRNNLIYYNDFVKTLKSEIMVCTSGFIQNLYVWSCEKNRLKKKTQAVV